MSLYRTRAVGGCLLSKHQGKKTPIDTGHQALLSPTNSIFGAAQKETSSGAREKTIERWVLWTHQIESAGTRKADWEGAIEQTHH